MAWHHHESGDMSDSFNIPNDPVTLTAFGHVDQINHLSDLLLTIDDHNLTEWDEQKNKAFCGTDGMAPEEAFYIDSDDRKNTIPPLMKRFIKTFKDKK